MTNTDNTDLKKAFEAYINAHQKLAQLWAEQNDSGDLFVKDYPFDSSFDDELLHDVIQWRNTSLEYLESITESIEERIEELSLKSVAGIQWLQAAGVLSEVIQIDTHYSGGGYEHIFLMMKDHRIITLHLTDENIDLSYKQWANFEEYLNADHENGANGFGYEPNQPNGEERCLDLTPETVETIFNLYKKTKVS